MERVYLLLWLADIAGNIGFVGAVSVVALMITAVLGMFVAAAGELGETEIPKAVRGAMRIGKWLIAIVLVAVLIPDAKTIRVMAAASAADVAVSMPLGTKAMQAIEAVLDGIIASKPRK